MLSWKYLFLKCCLNIVAGEEIQLFYIIFLKNKQQKYFTSLYAYKQSNYSFFLKYLSFSLVVF